MLLTRTLSTQARLHARTQAARAMSSGSLTMELDGVFETHRTLPFRCDSLSLFY